MPTLRFSLQLDKYKPTPETTAEPPPTDVAAKCSPRWAFHEYLSPPFIVTSKPEKWQDDEDTDEKACAACNNFTIPGQYCCSTCRTTYCSETCRDIVPTQHERICNALAESRTKLRPSEHHYRALFLPCRIDQPQLVWLKVTFDDSIGKVHFETDCQEAFEYVRDMQLPAHALDINAEFSVARSPYGCALVTFNSNENFVRQEKWYNRSLMGFATPGHVHCVYGPAFLITYDVGNASIARKARAARVTARNKTSDEGLVDNKSEGNNVDVECDDGHSVGDESDEAKRKKGKAKGNSGKTKRGKNKRKKTTPRTRTDSKANTGKADPVSVDNADGTPSDIVNAIGPFGGCEDIGIREIYTTINAYIASVHNPADGCPWAPVSDDPSSTQLHAIKINNIEDDRLKALGVTKEMESTSISRLKFQYVYMGSGCAEMYRLGLRWHLQPTMPNCPPLSGFSPNKDMDFMAYEDLFGNVFWPQAELPQDGISFGKFDIDGSMTLVQVNGGRIRPEHIKAVTGYAALARFTRTPMTQEGCKIYCASWIGKHGNVDSNLTSPYDLEKEGDGLWRGSEYAVFMMQNLSEEDCDEKRKHWRWSLKSRK